MRKRQAPSAILRTKAASTSTWWTENLPWIRLLRGGIQWRHRAMVRVVRV